MKKEDWWFAMVHTTENARPWVTFLIGQVTITAQMCPGPNLSAGFMQHVCALSG